MQYINPRMLKDRFTEFRSGKYFVDKTGIINEVIKYIGVQEKYLCLTRPRRFGKTTNVQMVACFLARGLEAEELFEGLEVTKNEEAMRHFAAHDVIYIDFSKLPFEGCSYKDYMQAIKSGIKKDIQNLYPSLQLNNNELDILGALNEAYNAEGARFCFIMDEWDSMFSNDRLKDGAKDFLMFLKQLLKDSPYVKLAYMTGVMPINKYTSGSELNMFAEFSPFNDPLFDKYFGFSESEVKQLLARHKKLMPNSSVTFEGLKHWYDGYVADDGTSKFNPRSVVLALSGGKLFSYWTTSGPRDEVLTYIKYNAASVRDDVVKMVDGQSVKTDPECYAASDMVIETREDILSAMVVYGLLTYHEGYVKIPNYELMIQFVRVLKKKELGYVYEFARRSEHLLYATLAGEADTVAQIIQEAHNQEVPLIRYRNEAALAAFINLMYLQARDEYEVLQELHGGIGFADIAFIPINRESPSLTPFVVELKMASKNESVKDALTSAMQQIKSRNYTAMFNDALTGNQKFANSPLAIAIAWDAENKQHECAIEGL